MGLNDRHTRGWRREEEKEKNDKRNPSKIEFVEQAWRTTPHKGANRTHHFIDKNTWIAKKNREEIQLQSRKPKGSSEKVMQLMDNIRNRKRIK